MPGKGHNEAANSPNPDEEKGSGTEEGREPVSDQSQNTAKLAFWDRGKKPSEQPRKKSSNLDKSSGRERSQEKSDSGLLFFPSRNQPSERSQDHLTESESEPIVDPSFDRELWRKQSDGAQWLSNNLLDTASGVSEDPYFLRERPEAEDAPYLDPESGLLDEPWNVPIKGASQRAQERADERARIQERVRGHKLQMPDEPQKSWRSKSFKEAAGDKPESLQAKPYDEFRPDSPPGGTDPIRSPQLPQSPVLGHTPASSAPAPEPTVAPIPQEAAVASRRPSSEALPQAKGKDLDYARGADRIRHWYLSRLKARSKNTQAAATANRKREILSQISPGASSLSTASVVLVVALVLAVAGSICSALNLIPSIAQLLPAAAAVGIAIGAFMVYQFEQRFRSFKKQIEDRKSSETKDLDELGLVEYLLKIQECELVELRDREQTVVDFTDDMLCTLNNRFVVTYANDALLKACGYSRDRFLAKNLSDLIVDEKEGTFKALASARSSKREVLFENMIRCFDGAGLDLKWTVEYSESDDCYFCTARDITALKASARTHGQFLGLLDEEFKLPLTAIQGALSMLRIGAYGALPEQMLLRAGGIEKTTSQLIRLISDLVDLERLDNGKIELRIDDFPISVVTEQAVEAVQALADQKNVRLQVKNNRTRMSADSERLLRVIVNLLSTGIYLSYENSALLVDIVELETAVEIQVKCHGRPLSAAELSRLFDRSKNTGLTDATMSSAVVMGMSVSKGIVEKHGGSLQVQSVDGKGTIIVCLIPKILKQGLKGSHFG